MTKPAWLFVFIAYLITWTITLSGYFSFRGGAILLDQLNLIYNFGALGPFIAAIVCARCFYPPDGVKTLFGAVGFIRLSLNSLALSLSPLVFFAIGWLLYPLFSGHWFSFDETRRQFHLTSSLSYVGWISPFVTYSIFEEFGWRGFLLPHLQERRTALQATTILTIIWACWHLPLFLWRFQFTAFITVGFFFSIFVGAIIITSIFNLSRGSIVPVILFHFTTNVASALDKEHIVVVVSVCFVFLAIYVIRRYKTENLADTPRVRNCYLTEVTSSSSTPRRF